MTRVTSWWWVRHAPVTTAGGRIYGQRDLDADCTDRAVFEWLAEHLPAEPLWVTSQLRRTRQTAEAIWDAGRQGAVEPLVDPDLAEQHFGDWQGLTYEELNRQRNGRWHRFWLAPAAEVPPGGESFEQLIGRVGGALDRLHDSHGGRDIVAVAHGGTIRAALAIALGIEPERALAFTVANCSLTRLDHIEGKDGAAWRVVCVNRLPGGAN